MRRIQVKSRKGFGTNHFFMKPTQSLSCEMANIVSKHIVSKFEMSQFAVARIQRYAISHFAAARFQTEIKRSVI